MALASHLPIEIISMDSAQVYCSMDIGTAKPSADERQAVPHHLIDLIDPAQAYSAARFVSDAGRLIGEIFQRGHHPILVGGTMLYAKALTEGLNNLPAANPAVRADLDRQANQIGWPAMYQLLEQVDPTTAARLQPADAQRIQRALEIHTITGRAMSELLRSSRQPPTDWQFMPIALEPADRSVLHQRIAVRFAQMMQHGFVDEVRRLRSREDLHTGLPSMRCVGYRQLWHWLQAGADSRSLDQAVQAGIAATRQLAKRQLTWLRSMPHRQVVNCLEANWIEQVIAMAMTSQRDN